MEVMAYPTRSYICLHFRWLSDCPCIQWERDSRQDVPVYTFPESDLLESLLSLYFNHWNCLFPLLHEPTFRQQIRERYHIRDRFFGAIVLLVCALASKESSDPRVLLPEYGNPPLSAGWRWFSQVKIILFGMSHEGDEIPSLQFCFVSDNQSIEPPHLLISF